MSVRDVLVRFRATVDGFTTPVDKARARVEALNESVARVADTKAWKQTGTAALAAGAAITAGVGLAVKAALDWQTAWTGVLKTVNASPEQFAVLEDQLKALARILPVTSTEIAGVAEVAGQLGVKADDIAGFTKTMIDLGVATNLTSEEASTAIAQIANIMGITGDGIQRFGATLVALGNNSATTERDILAMTQRLAAAGRLIGLSSSDVLAYSAALSSVGVEAEAGGTAISMSFQKIANYVDQGGDKLATVAKVAGVSADTFQRRWGEDAAGAMAAFVTGLNAVQKEGGSASRVLDDLGLAGIRQKTALLSLATSGDLLTRSLQLGSKAWSENSALAAETARRYATTESRIQIAQNTITQAAAEIGTTMLPALADFANGVADVTAKVADMPGPLKAVIAYGGGFAGASLLALGGAMKLATGLTTLKANVSLLSEQFPKLSAKLAGVNWTKLAVGASIAAAAITAFSAIMSAVSEHAEGFLISADGVAQGLAAIGKAGVGLAPVELQVRRLNEALNAVGAGRNSQLGGVADLLATGARNATDFWGQLDRVTDGFLGIRTAGGLVSDEIDKIDQGLNGLATGGNVDEAQRAFRALRDEVAPLGVGVDQLSGQFDAFRDTLVQTAGQLGITDLSAEQLGRWMAGEMPASVRAAAAAHPELVANLTEAQQAMVNTTSASDSVSASLQAQAEATRDAAKAQVEASGSQVSWHQALVTTAKALEDVTVSTNKSHTAINLNTKAGRANQTTLNSLANSALNTATAMEKSGASADEVSKVMRRSRSAFVEAATKMGLTKAAARELADSYGLIPDKKTTGVSEKGAEDAKTNVDDLGNAVDSLPDKTTVTVGQKGAAGAKSAIDGVRDALGKIDGQVATSYIKTKTVGENASTPPTLHKAWGGWVEGPGTWTSDSILTALSRDEFVVRAARAMAIEKAYPGFLSYLNSSAPLGSGMASGGSPTVASYAPAQTYAPQVIVQVPTSDGSGSAGVTLADIRAALDGATLVLDGADMFAKHYTARVKLMEAMS